MYPKTNRQLHPSLPYKKSAWDRKKVRLRQKTTEPIRYYLLIEIIENKSHLLR